MVIARLVRPLAELSSLLMVTELQAPWWILERGKTAKANIYTNGVSLSTGYAAKRHNSQLISTAKSVIV